MRRLVVHGFAGRSAGVSPRARSSVTGVPNVAPAPDEHADGYAEKLVKYIPYEATAAFIGLLAFVPQFDVTGAATAPASIFCGISFALGLALTVGFMYLQKEPAGRPLPKFYVGLSMASFVGWAYSPLLTALMSFDKNYWSHWLHVAPPLVVLGTFSLLIPLADELLTRWYRGEEAKPLEGNDHTEATGLDKEGVHLDAEPLQIPTEGVIDEGPEIPT